MKFCEIIIKPQSAFGTPLKGDTIFGHFCWQCALDPDVCGATIDELLRSYLSSPPFVFSSALPVVKDGDSKLYYLNRPTVPLSWYKKDDANIKIDECSAVKHRKELKAKKFFVVSDKELFNLSLCEDRLKNSSHKENDFIQIDYEQSHNSINRLTGTTSEGDFAPFQQTNFCFFDTIALAVFVVFDDAYISVASIEDGMQRIGECGFGRDASTGLGRFLVEKVSEINVPKPVNVQSVVTLAPCVPAIDSYIESYFVPFTRFGRHGANLAVSRNPFKAPVIMADEGAVFKLSEGKQQEWQIIGSAVSNVSVVQPRAVTQGYAPCLPICLE